MLTTFDGLTQYPLNDLQMQKTARLKLEYIHLDSINMTLYAMIAWSDSVKDMQMNIIVGLDDLVIIKEDQISNLKSQIVLEKDKFWLAGDQIKKERRLKWIFMGTTVVMAGFLTLSLL